MQQQSHSKQSLVLIELILVILFFALSAAIFMQIFASARLTSEASKDLGSAVIAAESAAECFKASEGDLALAAELLTATVDADGALVLYYDSLWQPSAAANSYAMLSMHLADSSTAQITVRLCQGAEADSMLYQLSVQIPKGVR